MKIVITDNKKVKMERCKMCDAINIKSPYSNDGKWLKGSFHIHSRFSPCGMHSIDELELAYRYYDFVAITDHNRVTTEIEKLKNKIVFNGIEVGGKHHMLLVEPPKDLMNDYSEEFSVENYQKLINRCNENDGVSVFNHPARVSSTAWKANDLDAISGCTAMEIFSGDGINVEEDTAFEQWDRLLSNGKRIWGIGNDDFHHWGQERRVWNMVCVSEVSKAGILKAVKNGDFYVSTGFGFESIRVKEGKIYFKLLGGELVLDRAYKYLTLFGSNGRVLAEKTGYFEEFEYTPDGTEGYVRAAAYVNGGYATFSQPIYVGGSNI